MITPVAIANIGWRTYIIWAVFNFAFIWIVYLFYPETRGLTLEEADRIFEGGDGLTRGAIGFGAKHIHDLSSPWFEEKAHKAGTVHAESTAQ